MKRSKANQGMRNRSYQALAALALSILTFAAGQAHAAEPFKAWKVTKKTAAEVGRLTDEKEISQSTKWLATDASQENVAKFVKTFAKEPVKFVEGVRLAALELGKDSSKFDKNKKELVKKLEKVAEKEFGVNRKAVLKILAESILDIDPKDLAKKDLEDLLRDLFTEDVLKALGLVDEDPTKKDETKKDEPKKDEPKKDEPKKDEPKKDEPKKDEPKKDDDAQAKAELERQRAELAAREAEIARRELEARNRAEVRPAPGTPVLPQAPSIPSAPNGGELNDAALQRTAQETCDRLDALKRANENQLLSVVNPLKDALNEQFNQLAALQRNNGQQQQQKQNKLEDLLPQLLQQALNGDQGKRRNDFTPPPQPQQQQAQRQNDNQDKNRSVFDQPIPERQEEPQQAQAPLYITSLPSADTQLGNIRLGLPTATGRTELRSAMDRVSMNDARSPVATTLGPNPMPADIIQAKVRVQGDLRATQAELNQAKYRASELEGQLEAAQSGGARAFLDPKFKRAEKDSKAEVEAKKKQYEGLRAQLQQGGNAEQASQMQPILQQYQAEVTEAEAKAKRVSDEIELALENGEPEIKRMAKNRDQLNAVVTKLTEQVGVLRDEETGLGQALTNAQELQVQALNNAAQQQQAPRFGNGNPVRSSTIGNSLSRYSGSRSTGSTATVPAGSGDARRGGLARP